eukprot:8139428-Ditylum_brightwellii.AAC.1
MEAIINVRVTNSDAKSYLLKMVKKCSKDQEKGKRIIDGVLAHEVKMTLKQIEQALAKKWSCHHSHMQKYINTMISVVIVCATHQCLCGSRVPAKCTNPNLLPFEESTGLRLFH